MYSEKTLIDCCGERVSCVTEKGIMRGYHFYGSGSFEAYIETSPGIWGERTVTKIIRDGGTLASQALKSTLSISAMREWVGVIL
jgi:hypothetical protein